MSSDEEETDYVSQIESLQTEIKTMIDGNSEIVKLDTKEIELLNLDPERLVSNDEDDGGNNTKLLKLNRQLELLLQKIESVIQKHKEELKKEKKQKN